MADWRNQIKIKQFLNDNTSDKYVAELCGYMIQQLEKVLEKEKKLGKIDEDILEELDDIIQEFKWIKESAEYKKDASKFTYKNWCEAFNEQLEALYNLGDMIITKKDFYNDEKFLWVG